MTIWGVLFDDKIAHKYRYGSAYMLPTCAFQLLAGKLYSRYSAKWVFLGSLIVFEVGSLICAVAPSSEVFIVGRAISGVGAAALFSGSMILIAILTPPDKTPAFQSLNGAMFGIASAVAPLVCFTRSQRKLMLVLTELGPFRLAVLSRTM